MIRLISITIAMLGAVGALWGGGSKAANVKVEEVTISLYNKPVTGFRVVLDRSQSLVSRKIVEHVAEYDDAKPFEYERTVIFENIRYSPITDERDISLYFLLRNLQGQFTELTYVAMYDYKRSVSSRQFPHLALLLQIDLAKIVRGIAGDILESDDLVFDDATLKQLAEDGIETAAETGGDPDLEHFQEEEVENSSVLIRHDPFEPKTTTPSKSESTGETASDTTLARLQKRIQELEAREKQLMASESALRAEQDLMARKQDLMMEKVKENKSLRDSIVMLNKRVEGMLGQYYVSDDISVSNETFERIFELERLKERNERQIVQLDQQNDSLGRIANNMRTQLESLSDSRRNQAETLVQLEKENEGLKTEVKQLRSQNTALSQASQGTQGTDSLLSLLAMGRERSREIESRMAEGERETSRLREENDWLTGKKLQLEERITDLEAENRDLHKQLDATLPGTVVIPESPDQDRLDKMEAEQKRLEQQVSSLQADKKKLQGKLQDLESELAGTRANGGNISSPPESALRDSLMVLRQRLNSLKGQEAENARLQEQLEAQKSTLQSRNAEVKRLSTDLEGKNQALSQAENQNRSLKTELESARKDKDKIAGNLRQKQEEVQRLTDEKQKLEARLDNLRSQSGQSDAQVQTLLDSIDLMQREKASLKNDILNRDRQMRKQIQRSDSLQNLIAQGENQRNDLRRQLSQLESRLDSLKRTSAPENDQQQFMREQWAKLQQWEKELNARDKTSGDKEKLLDQRQTFLDKKEADLASRESQLKDLKAREEALRLREQELNSREGSSGLIVRTEDIEINRVMEFGTTVPVFLVETPLRYQLAQKQVVAYMLSRNEILDEQFPDILYRSVMFPELDLQPVEFRVRISSEGTGTVIKFSFRLADGSYLGENSSRKVTDKAKQLISNLLRYKYQG